MSQFTVAASARPAADAREAEVPELWNPGDTILGLYRVDRVLEGGAMGLVYRVRHVGWDVDLAVKSPRPEYFATEAQKVDFEREAETWVGLGLHPHVASCAYVRRLGGIPRVFAEWVNGGSLADWVSERRVYEGGQEEALARVLDLSIQVAWGLDHAHALGLVHQDVKPGNVLVTEDGVAKVTDFGLARARAAAEGAERMPDLGPGASYAGLTPAYCSPEQAEAHAMAVAGEPAPKLSTSTDAWSYALCVVELLRGGRSWMHGAAGSAVLAGLSEPGPTEVALPQLPPTLLDLLARCLERDPNRRPALAELAAELAAIYERELRRPYPRPEPEPARLLADGLSNYALSMLDLGHDDEAERLFDEALASDPHNPHAVYNRGLRRWRTGTLSDERLVGELESVRRSHAGGWMADHLLALVHLERGDTQQATALLDQAARAAPEEGEVRDALALARRLGGARCLRTLEGLDAVVHSLAITHDGRRAVSVSGDQPVCMWDLETGGCLKRFADLGGWARSVAVTANGRLGVTGNEDGTLRLLDLETGRGLDTLAGHEGSVMSVALTPDGRVGLSGGDDGRLRVWSPDAGRCLRTLEGHTDRVWSVALTADGRLGLSGSADETLRVWDLGTGRCLRTIQCHVHPADALSPAGSVSSVALIPDGRLALAASEMIDGLETSQSLRLWEVETGRCLRVIEVEGDQVSSVALSEDGRLALSGSADGSVRLWEPQAGRHVRRLEGHELPVRSVALTPDGHLGLSGGGGSSRPFSRHDEPMRVWGPSLRPELRAPWSYTRPRAAHELTGEAAAVRERLSAARRLIEAGDGGAAAAEVREARAIAGHERHPELLELWRAAGRSGRRTRLLAAWHAGTLEGHRDLVRAASLSADGRIAVSGGFDGALRTWDLGIGRCVQTLEAHDARVSSLALSGDGLLALTSAWDDDRVHVWDMEAGRALRTFEGHSKDVRCVALTPDGRLALSSGYDGMAYLWEVETARVLRAVGHGVDAVALTPDGRVGLSDRFEKICVWDLDTGEDLHTLTGHDHHLWSLAVTPDGRLGLSGSIDETARLWDLRTGDCLRTLEGSGGPVYSVALTPDGRVGLSGSDDGAVRIWDLDTGECLSTLTGHRGTVTSVAITPEGCRAVSAGEDTTLRVWELDWDYEFAGGRE